jgi:hypothetical protein
MANFNVHLTEKGLDTLLKSGLLNSVNYFSLSDEKIIYGIDDGTTKPAYNKIPIVGSRDGFTTIPSCSMAERKPLPVEELTESEIVTMDRRVKMAFVSEDCSVPFEKSNVTVKVNVEKWIEDLLALTSTDYVKTASGLRLDFWDYIIGYVQEYNLTTSTWKDKEVYKDNLDIRYVVKNEKDYDTYKKVSPKYMSITNGTKRFVNEQNKTRFSSNMALGFRTNSVDGVSVYNTSGYLGLYPDKYGYLLDGIFYNVGDAEEAIKANGIGTYKTVYPTVVINGVNYWLKNDTDYRVSDNSGTGFMVWGYENKAGEKAVKGLTDKLKLFMKSNGTEIETGVYQLKLGFDTNLLSNNMFNEAYKNKSVGGDLTFELTYNTNSVSTDVYTIE